jgi:dTDP-glucose 4,6-dehydratase
VSTDEVFGSLGDGASSPRRRPTPRLAVLGEQGGVDHLVRAWHHTYGLPGWSPNCSNNYGPYQFPEKLIPLVILNALDGQPLPVYGAARTCATGSTWTTTPTRS